MAAKKRIKQKHGGVLTPFQKGENGGSRGRGKSEITKIREQFELKYDWRISKSDAEQLLHMLVFAPLPELQQLAKNPNLPAVVVNYIHALFADIKAGRINAAKDIVEFNFGKAQQKITVENVVEPETFELNVNKLLSTAEYIISSCLDLTALESLKEKLDDVIVRKRSEGAKIINQEV